MFHVKQSVMATPIRAEKRLSPYNGLLTMLSLQSVACFESMKHQPKARVTTACRSL